MIRRPPRSTLSSSSAASDVYKRQEYGGHFTENMMTTSRAVLFLLCIGLCAQVALCDKAEDAFTTGDENQDGKLSKKELRAAMEPLGVQLNKADAVLSSSIHDINSDNRIDLAEFRDLAATELSSLGTFGRLSRRVLQAAGGLGLAEGAAHYIDRFGLGGTAYAVNPPAYGFYTSAIVVLLPLYLFGVFFGWQHEWFVKHRVYLNAATLGGLVTLVLFAKFDLPNDVPGYVVMLGFVLGNLFALEYLFDDESAKKKRTKGRGKHVAKMMAGRKK
eukprot:TRINITY_DN4388_c0_g1_i2.p1 TRINITY_DN4388_c0_g1~~TRINITY_DN4388_c0_g1_i2.p1  ORF type:complete len:274 (+),score=85.71 TRINITY_DN4388_c0_g1_i2:125-946(+)